MNWIDLLLLALVLLGALNGARRGLVLGVIDLLGWVAGLALALSFAEPLGAWLAPRVPWPAAWSTPVAFLGIFLLSGVVAAALAGAVAAWLHKGRGAQGAERALGVLPGLLAGAIVATLATAALLSPLMPPRAQAAASDSALAGLLAEPAGQLVAGLEPILSAIPAAPSPVQVIPPDSEQIVELPFTVADGQPSPQLEARMLELLNEERAEAGLPPLAMDPALTEVARRHSQDMFERGYFAHVSPDGVTPFDRIEQAGIGYAAAGENLALAPTIERAHTGLMESPGHRENILRPLFGRVGIGVVDGGPRGLMVSQVFRD
ncbi:MAG TPA: CvpA family protein [Chloroflexaceae bacterium]|nr:CvpA family protein [Chloroflexaceae bacterium]